MYTKAKTDATNGATLMVAMVRRTGTGSLG